jgi:hypothetical protein
MHQTPDGTTTFGYLSTVESAEHGFFGGYLIVSLLGRPLEFHCTAPIRPSRAQQILYGATLQPYLLGEQIAGTLLAKAETRPQIILTDQPSVLCQRAKWSIPLVCLVPRNDASSSVRRRFLVSGHTCELPLGSESDCDSVVALLTSLAAHVELPEPFVRIHEAIREAQRIGERGTDAHDQAA